MGLGDDSNSKAGYAWFSKKSVRPMEILGGKIFEKNFGKVFEGKNHVHLRWNAFWKSAHHSINVLSHN